jgi:hypothetical protein
LSIARIQLPGLSITIPRATPGSAPIPVPIPGAPQLPDTPFPPVPLPFGGQTLPAPDVGFKDGYFSMTLPGFGANQYAVPAPAVLKAFATAGYVVTYQPARQTDTGIEGATFDVAYNAPGFPDNPYFSGPVPTTYTIGKATASITLNPATPDADPALSGTSTTPAAGPAPGAESSVDAAFGALSGPGPDTGGVSSAAPKDAGVTRDIQTATFVPAAASKATDLSAVYVALGAIALAALLSMTALSLVGVRSTWRS